LIRIISQQPRWLLGLVFFGFFLTLGLLLLGAKGNEMVGPLSLFVSIVSAALTILFRPRVPPDEDREVAEPNWWAVIVSTSAVVLALGVVVAVVYTTFFHKADLRVTDQTKVVVGTGTAGAVMADGDKATVDILTPPLGRNHLAMTLRLINPGKTGNCVGPTRLEIAPITDGLVGNPLPAPVSSMEEFRLNIANSTRPGVQVRTVDETQGCMLNLEVQDAVLYNDFPW
jgi:hypothetical protein